MENDHKTVTYAFLTDERVEKNFAEINILLFSGKHIDQRYYTIFSLLEETKSHWYDFYKNLYSLHFTEGYFDGEKYFYLDFFDTSKGRFADSTRHRELTETQVLVGLVLLDMYFKQYFEEKKIIKWEQLVKLIIESEHHTLYQKIFFSSARRSNAYDDKDWKLAERKITSVVDFFDKLGWVEKLSGQNEELVFEIRPAINRLVKLYEYELSHFEDFINHLNRSEET